MLDQDKRKGERRADAKFTKDNENVEKTSPHLMCEKECIALKKLIYRAISIVGQHDQVLRDEMQEAINKK